MDNLDLTQPENAAPTQTEQAIAEVADVSAAVGAVKPSTAQTVTSAVAVAAAHPAVLSGKVTPNNLISLFLDLVLHGLIKF